MFADGSGPEGAFVQLFDGAGQPLDRWPGGKRPRVACDPGGKFLAASGLEHDVALIALPDGARRTLSKSGARALAFSPDGLRLATAGQSIRLWDTESGNETLTLTVPARLFPRYFFTDEDKKKHGIFFTDVQITAQMIAGRTCEGSVWLWKAHAPSLRTARAITISLQALPIGILPGDALAAHGIRWENGAGAAMTIQDVTTPRFDDVPEKARQAICAMPLGADRAMVSSRTNGNWLADARTFRFAEPLRSFAFTRLGVVNGASLARWRLEALDAEGKILATTGEMEFGKDALPRTYGVRADGIRSVRFLVRQQRRKKSTLCHDDFHSDCRIRSRTLGRPNEPAAEPGRDVILARGLGDRCGLHVIAAVAVSMGAAYLVSPT